MKLSFKPAGCPKDSLFVDGPGTEGVWLRSFRTPLRVDARIARPNRQRLLELTADESGKSLRRISLGLLKGLIPSSLDCLTTQHDDKTRRKGWNNGLGGIITKTFSVNSVTFRSIRANRGSRCACTLRPRPSATSITVGPGKESIAIRNRSGF